MRAVIDTNILIRAAIKPLGTVGPVLSQLRDKRYAILYSESLLAELVDVLNRPRIRDKYDLSDDDIKTILGLILLRGEAVTPQGEISVCRDPKDYKFLEAAVAGGLMQSPVATRTYSSFIPSKASPLSPQTPSLKCSQLIPFKESDPLGS